MFDSLGQIGLLLLQVVHFLVLGFSLLYLCRYYSGHKFTRLYFQHAMAWGILSIPISMVLFFIMLIYGDLTDTIMYAFFFLLGFSPIILARLGKD